MNNKSLFIGFVLFAGGVGAGYFFGNKRAKAQYQADLAEVKDFYAARLDDMGVQEAGFEPQRGADPEELEATEETDESEEYDERISEEYFNKISGYSTAVVGTEGQRGKGKPLIKYNKPPIEVVAYGEIEQPEPEEDPDEDDDEDYEDYDAELDARAEELAIRRNENQRGNKPYTINHDEYEDAPDNYSKQILYYYQEDRVLCEDDDSIVEDEEGLVGFDYEDVLDMQTTAWVRNDAIMTTYQIHRLPYAYSKVVANVIETPREREYRILGRRKHGLDS